MWNLFCIGAAGVAKGVGVLLGLFGCLWALVMFSGSPGGGTVLLVLSLASLQKPHPLLSVLLFFNLLSKVGRI